MTKMLRFKEIINRKDTWIVFIFWAVMTVGALLNIRLDAKNITQYHLIYATLESAIYLTSILFMSKIIKIKSSKSYEKQYSFLIKLCSVLASAVYILGFHFLFRLLIQDDIDRRIPVEYFLIFAYIYALFLNILKDG